MVSIIEYKGKTNGDLMSIAGKSTDEKPIKEIDGIAILNEIFIGKILGLICVTAYGSFSIHCSF